MRYTFRFSEDVVIEVEYEYGRPYLLLVGGHTSHNRELLFAYLDVDRNSIFFKSCASGIMPANSYAREQFDELISRYEAMYLNSVQFNFIHRLNAQSLGISQEDIHRLTLLNNS